MNQGPLPRPRRRRLLGGGSLSPSEPDRSAPSASASESSAPPVEEEPEQPPVDALAWTEPRIEQAVRDWLDKPQGPITREELGGAERIRLRGNTVTINDGDESVNGINAEERGEIQSLADIANFPALTEIIAVNNPISDLSPLAGMEALWLVHIRQCDVENLAPLAALPNLTHLHITHNQVSDIAPLGDCTSLRVLTLTGNKITDASPLSGFGNLEILDLQDNPVEDWSVLPQAEQLYGPPERAEYIVDERFGDLDSLFAQTQEELMTQGVIPEEMHTSDGYLEIYRADEIDGYYAFVPEWDAPAGGSTVQAIFTTTEVFLGVDSISIGALRDELFGPDLKIGSYQDMDDSIVHDIYVDTGAYIIFFTGAADIGDDNEVSQVYIIVRERTAIGRGEPIYG